MYAVILQKVGHTKTGTKQVSTPEGLGPYQTQNEAIGAAIDYLRTCGYNDSFFFDNYSENNVRVEILNKQTGNKNLVAFVIELG